MGGGDGGIEDRAQQRASVGHRFTGFEMEACDARLSIRFRQKKTPMACDGGSYRVPDAARHSSCRSAEPGPMNSP
jgi:hypothetical protein